jgi:hypothetical protein
MVATTRDRAARVTAAPAAEPGGGRSGPGRTALDDTSFLTGVGASNALWLAGAAIPGCEL